MHEEQVRAALERAGFENARGEARLLSEHYAGEVPQAVVERRLSHEPLQYLLGEWWFYRERYAVSPACLIPRADTETLVEQAVRHLPQNARFLDLCTGSGCVAVSTLCARPDTVAVAVDKFEETLTLARHNAKVNGVAGRCAFLKADVLEEAPELGQFDAVLSNPPYIPNAVVPTLSPEVQHEPPAALCGGCDGLDFYRAMLTHWVKCLRPGGFWLFEIGYDQAEDLRRLAAAHALSFELTRDLGGRDRVVRLF